MLGNYLQQTTIADDIFRCIFYLPLKGLNFTVKERTGLEVMKFFVMLYMLNSTEHTFFPALKCLACGL